MTVTLQPRRWIRSTLILISYGVEARTPDHWRSSGLFLTPIPLHVSTLVFPYYSSLPPLTHLNTAVAVDSIKFNITPPAAWWPNGF
ncbi:hypothetical protein CDAR_373111 [Caerostris darwini]|uniref:Secreted protein n=1 Tax=Caerostris darwini TaxID=1538125 RepID=A0AAV4X6A1_9ARAC|nr:hypothetical protein CDAR_373111 [Caerostris darwini]